MVLPAVLAQAWTLCAWCAAWLWFCPTKVCTAYIHAGIFAGLNSCVASVSMSCVLLSVQQHWRCSENKWSRGSGAYQPLLPIHTSATLRKLLHLTACLDVEPDSRRYSLPTHGWFNLDKNYLQFPSISIIFPADHIKFPPQQIIHPPYREVK